MGTAFLKVMIMTATCRPWFILLHLLSGDSSCIAKTIQQTALGNQQPVSGNQQPVSGNQQPVSVNQQPVSGNQQPVSGNQQPASGNQQPVSGNQQPASSNQQPVSGNQQPVSGNQQTELSNHQTDSKNSEPISGNQQPAEGIQQPASGNQLPASENQQPVLNDQQPALPNKQPAPSNQQPVPSSKQPAPANKQLAPGNQQPVSADNQPAPSNQQSVQQAVSRKRLIKFNPVEHQSKSEIKGEISSYGNRMNRLLTVMKKDNTKSSDLDETDIGGYDDQFELTNDMPYHCESCTVVLNRVLGAFSYSGGTDEELKESIRTGCKTQQTEPYWQCSMMYLPRYKDIKNRLLEIGDSMNPEEFSTGICTGLMFCEEDILSEKDGQSSDVEITYQDSSFGFVGIKN